MLLRELKEEITMNIVLGFGSTETEFEEQERKFVEDYLEANKHKEEDTTDWYTFKDECVEGLKKALKERSDEYRRQSDEYKTATDYPERYSYYYFTILHNWSYVAVIFKFGHINRRHALSPDGWAAMWTEPVFVFKANK
jgi:hypothetical protein